MSARLLFVCLLAAAGIASCLRQKRQIRPAFYYWQTAYQPDSASLACLDAADCKTLYIKILDIGVDDVSGAIQPYARLVLNDSAGLSGRTIVPCIFITNAVFETIRTGQIEWLAAKVDTVLRKHPLYGLLKGTWELQIDCDWTPGTRKPFFQFLRRLRDALPPGARLSATIRLHQYKYPGQTGVPPVDRGMLMFYNTGDIDDPEERNSIFDLTEARAYLEGAPRRYPLPLDVALPLFSWSLVYRDGALWKIIPDLQPPELADTAFFEPEPVAQAASARPVWTVRQATLRDGQYLRPGDRIRWEALSPAELRAAAGLAARFDLAPDAQAAFFYLDSACIRRFPAGHLRQVCSILELR